MHWVGVGKYKRSPLCYCSAVCKGCRKVASNLERFESTYREIQLALLDYDMEGATRYPKSSIKNPSGSHKHPTMKKEKKPSTSGASRCKTVSCLTNPNEDLLKENALLNEYFDIFEERYRVNRGELEQLKNQNMYLRGMMEQFSSRGKQKESQDQMEDLPDHNSKISFSKRENEIIKKRLLEDVTNRGEYCGFRETTSTFLPGFSKNHRRFPGKDWNSRGYSEQGETPSNENYYTSNDENERYY